MSLYDFINLIQSVMIGAKVVLSDDFSDKLRRFVKEKVTQQYASILPQHDHQQEIRYSNNYGKRTLSDWRKIFPKPHIPPHQQNLPLTKPQTANYRRTHIYSQGSKRPPKTIQSTIRPTHTSCSTRKRYLKKQNPSMIDFLIAQHHYQAQVLGNKDLQQSVNNKMREFYMRVGGEKKRECLRVSKWISEMDVQGEDKGQGRKENATERYKREMRQQPLVIRLCNTVKIKQKHKLKFSNGQFKL